MFAGPALSTSTRRLTVSPGWTRPSPMGVLLARSNVFSAVTWTASGVRNASPIWISGSGASCMNVPVVTFETPSWHSPSGPGIESPQTRTVVGISLNSRPPGRQNVLVAPGATVVVPGLIVQIGVPSAVSGPGSGQVAGREYDGVRFGHDGSAGPDGFGFGQCPGTGSAGPGFPQNGGVGGGMLDGGCGAGGPGSQRQD